jgi:hypothetical protein
MAHLGPGKAASSKEQAGLRYPSNGKTIYHRPLNRTKTAELSQASFAYLFSEMVTYAQRRVTGIQELEKRYVPHPFSHPVPPLSQLTSPLPASTSKATPSGSSSSTYSSRANRRAPRHGPSPSSRCCTSSRSTCGRTFSGGRRTASRRARTRTRPTST